MVNTSTNIKKTKITSLLICLNTRKADIMTLEIQVLAWNVFRMFRLFRQCSDTSDLLDNVQNFQLIFRICTDFFRISKHKNWFIQNFLTLQCQVLAQDVYRSMGGALNHCSIGVGRKGSNPELPQNKWPNPEFTLQKYLIPDSRKIKMMNPGSRSG